MSLKGWRKQLSGVARNPLVWIAAFGYFVDVFDLISFGVVRIASLRSLGVPESEWLAVGARLLNLQMGGMLLGGFLWGILGDKLGRKSVLFGSIALYSAANFANAFVASVAQYSLLRFLAGLGLAGELGAAVTLIAEILPPETRAYGTTLVATVGLLGPVVAGVIGRAFPWPVIYAVGGLMGFALLVARAKLTESALFKAIPERLARGDLRLLLKSRDRWVRYLGCVAIGIPVWFAAGLLMIFAPEFSRALAVTGAVTAGGAVMANYGGAAIGDFTSGFLSQAFENRKKVVAGFILLWAASCAGFLACRGLSPFGFYAFCFALGLGNGYFGLFVTLAAEQFGTNLRSTAATTVPNLVRGAVIPLTMIFQFGQVRVGFIASASLLGAACVVLALTGLTRLRETFGTSLDFFER